MIDVEISLNSMFPTLFWNWKWKPGQKIPSRHHLTTPILDGGPGVVGIHPANSVGDDIEAKWGETQQKFLEKVENAEEFLLGGWSSISAHWEFVHSRVVCCFFAVSCPRFCVKSFCLEYSLQHGPGEARIVLVVRSTAARSATKWSASSMVCDSSWTWANPPIGARVISSHPRRRDGA